MWNLAIWVAFYLKNNRIIFVLCNKLLFYLLINCFILLNFMKNWNAKSSLIEMQNLIWLKCSYWLMVHCMMFNNSLACWTRLSWCDKKSLRWFFARIKGLSSIRLAYARCSLRALTRLLNIMQWTINL